MTCILKCLHSSKSELAFSPYGFQTWKNATQAFRKHESSTAHSDNVRAWWNYSKRVSCSGVEDSGWSWTTVCSKELVQKYFHYNFWQSKGYLTLQFLAEQGSKVVTKKKTIGPRTTSKMKLLKSRLILFGEVSCTMWKRTSDFRLLSTRLRTPASQSKWVYVWDT